MAIKDRGGDGSPVLLIHGSFAKDFLLPIAEELQGTGKFRVITYDRRGYGRKTVGEFSMVDQANDAAAVLRQLGIEKAHVYGHSTGGAIALQLARQSPELIASLSVGEADLPPSHLPSGAENEEGLKQLAGMYESSPKAEVLHVCLSSLHGEDYAEVVPEEIRNLAADDMGVWFKTEYPALLGWKFGAEDANAIPVNMQYIYGEKTLPMYKEVRDVLAEWDSDLVTVEVPDATHFAPFTHAQIVAKAIADFACP